MGEGQLYFNGVNGTTGKPGLAPMTVQELADRLSEDHFKADEQLRNLADGLRRDPQIQGKLQDLVDLLVQGTLAALDDPAFSRETWSAQMAQALIDLFLGQKYRGAGGVGVVQSLAERLRRDPQETLRTLTRLLLERNAEPLAGFLLGQEPDFGEDLKRNLKWATRQLIADLRREPLSDETAQALEQGALPVSVWLSGLIPGLHELPIEALKLAANNRGFSTDALRRLLAGLQAQPAFKPTSDALAALFPAPAANPEWAETVRALQEGIQALTGGADPVPWPALLPLLREWLARLSEVVGDLGVVPWVAPEKIAEAGWGVVFPAKMPESRRAAIKRALAPLLEWRQKQAGRLFRIYEQEQGYRPGESARDFLSRSHADPSRPVDPELAPYYMLLIGSPEEIPFEFQYQLDVQYAVGRLDFGEGEAAEAAYANYACNVVAAERRAPAPKRRLLFFGVRNPGDEATRLGAENLIQPLYNHFDQPKASWTIELVKGAEARRERLLQALQSSNPPALLFTASHGLELDPREAGRQRQNQGALICADWDGQPGELPPNAYLTGAEIRTQAGKLNLGGMIAFFFACYSAGTPRYDDYYRREFKTAGRVLAPQPFTADLPRALLGIPNGALAVVGHVERAWGNSFLSLTPARPQAKKAADDRYISVFTSAVTQLLRGYPVGAAMDFFNVRYAALSTELVPLLDRDPVDPYRLAEIWTSNFDARGYIVLGDPAVRLAAK